MRYIRKKKGWVRCNVRMCGCRWLTVLLGWLLFSVLCYTCCVALIVIHFIDLFVNHGLRWLAYSSEFGGKIQRAKLLIYKSGHTNRI